VDGWRLVYLAPLIGLPFFWVIGRRIPESRRFVRRTAASAKATLSGHRGRLAMLAASSFFALLFLAPNSQFQNDFLRNEHGFTALQLTLFTVLTNTPAGIGVVVGGRLADTRGRRRVGAIGTIGGAILLAAAYQVGGVWLWAFTVTGSIVAAVTVPALAVYGPELFPTSLRARANGVISLAGVLGSSAGLLIAGRMEDHLGRYGPGIALLAIGPLIVAALVLAFYPETAHLELEELNPEDEIPNPLSFPVL
jgi:MFS family permease